MNKNELFQFVSADFKIITRKTELWTIKYCSEILQDIELLLSSKYLSSIHLVMLDRNGSAIRCNQYNFTYNQFCNYNDRPGNNDWDNLGGKELLVVLGYTNDWRNLQEPNKSLFEKNFNIMWVPEEERLNLSHLKKSNTKKISLSNAFLQRIDYK